MRKIDWGRTIFVACFTGVVLGLLCKSYIMGIVIGCGNFVGGMIAGLIMGEKKVK